MTFNIELKPVNSFLLSEKLQLDKKVRTDLSTKTVQVANLKCSGDIDELLSTSSIYIEPRVKSHKFILQAPVPPTCSLCRLPFFQRSCSHPFPSFSPSFFFSLNVSVQIWTRDKGHTVQGLYLWETDCCCSLPHL